jgi:hypothetical protein
MQSTPWANVVRGEEPFEVILKAIEAEKGSMFWNMTDAQRKRKLGLTKVGKDESEERRFICPECVMGILAIDEERIKGWISEFGRGD